ncbi:DUF2141 domain-containing protein [Bdellovibrio sp. ArHS]|uniref:DUF2141 domain-containing protein n=1 Tax=Bdellovibrio sp. ArHS TaxID=1569284 RepID=UPI000AEAB6B1|nr:DUF2141 domain-containing protein [Bdellovibrio sp. ArHS]
MWKFKSVSFVLALFFTSNLQALTLNFTDLRNGEGYLAVSIFSALQKNAFPDDAAKAAKTFYVKLEGRKNLSLEVPDLTEEIYAIAVMHDEDGNRKFKTNFMGLPQEGFGFSGNPRVYFGAPAFSRAQFELSRTPSLDIRIKYF